MKLIVKSLNDKTNTTMKKRTIIATIAVALIAGVSVFVACSKEDNRNGYTKLDTDPISEEGCFYLGNQLENAYSVTNMQKAYDTLLANGMNDYVNVHCTHYYVKFYPETKAEYDLLMADTSLDLFDFPLDYELIGEGTLCSKNEDFNVLYTVVPVDLLSQISDTLSLKIALSLAKMPLKPKKRLKCSRLYLQTT